VLGEDGRMLIRVGGGGAESVGVWAFDLCTCFARIRGVTCVSFLSLGMFLLFSIVSF
jgi:hypothetical protein